jgi:hypothetical protein
MLYQEVWCWCMRTTVDLPDELLRQARQRAAEEGTTLTALLADGLRLRLRGTPAGRRRRRRLPVSKVRGGLQPWVDPASNASLLDAADGDRAAP